MSTDISIETEYPYVTMDEVDHIFDEEGNIIVGEKRMRLIGRAEGKAEGKAEGRYEGILDSIKRLMNNKGWDMAETMEALGIPDAEKPMYADKLAEDAKHDNLT